MAAEHRAVVQQIYGEGGWEWSCGSILAESPGCSCRLVESPGCSCRLADSPSCSCMLAERPGRGSCRLTRVPGAAPQLDRERGGRSASLSKPISQPTGPLKMCCAAAGSRAWWARRHT